jgi:hypothetical protein
VSDEAATLAALFQSIDADALGQDLFAPPIFFRQHDSVHF